MKRAIPAALLAATVAAAWLWGHHVGAAGVQSEWDASKASQAEALAKVQVSAAQVTTKVVTQYVDRVKVVHDKAAAIVKKVPVYVTAKADAACTVPAGFVRVHDAAAQGTELPDAATGADEAPSGVALSTIAGTVAGNYGLCRETAQQLSSLEDWARQQAALTTAEKAKP